jgi:hypothetical protein
MFKMLDQELHSCARTEIVVIETIALRGCAKGLLENSLTNGFHASLEPKNGTPIKLSFCYFTI